MNERPDETEGPTPDAPCGAAPAPPPSPDELAALRARAAAADELEDRLKRAQAEFVNESRRIQRQAEHDRRFALEGVLKELMEVVRSLDQALATPKPGAAVDALHEGIALVRRQVEDLLKRHGAEVLRPAGEPFDPLHHEAVAMVEHAELPPGSVAEVLSPGLKIHGRVSKAAQVLVTRAPSAPASAPPSAPPSATPSGDA
jgi:molecular chaperone GrpE